jgi:hypothetical protein
MKITKTTKKIKYSTDILQIFNKKKLNRMKGTLFYVALTLLLIFVGCNNGKVCFETDTYVARGTLNADGSYVVCSASEKDGLPKGKYRVYIFGAVKSISGPDGISLSESLIDEKYSKGETSGLTVDVPVSGRRFDITVEPNPNAEK